MNANNALNETTTLIRKTRSTFFIACSICLYFIFAGLTHDAKYEILYNQFHEFRIQLYSISKTGDMGLLTYINQSRGLANYYLYDVKEKTKLAFQESTNNSIKFSSNFSYYIRDIINALGPKKYDDVLDTKIIDLERYFNKTIPYEYISKVYIDNKYLQLLRSLNNSGRALELDHIEVYKWPDKTKKGYGEMIFVNCDPFNSLVNKLSSRKYVEHGIDIRYICFTFDAALGYLEFPYRSLVSYSRIPEISSGKEPYIHLTVDESIDILKAKNKIIPLNSFSFLGLSFTQVENYAFELSYYILLFTMLYLANLYIIVSRVIVLTNAADAEYITRLYVLFQNSKSKSFYFSISLLFIPTTSFLFVLKAKYIARNDFSNHTIILWVAFLLIISIILACLNYKINSILINAIKAFKKSQYGK